MRYRIIIDRAAIEAGEPAIHVIDNLTGDRRNYREVSIADDSRIVQGGPLQDGSRVWIEAAGIWATKP